jgi:hypothetical protein
MMDSARPANPAWAVALGISFIGCGLVLGLTLVAIAAAGPVSPAQGDQLWMMSFGLLFVVGVGAALTRSGTEDRHHAAGDADALFSAAFVLFMMAPSNILWRHVFDPQEEAGVRALVGLALLFPNFFVFRLMQAVVSVARDRRYGMNRK